jgi:hypothetical protein
MWSVVSGASFCEVISSGTCVTDGADNYGINERCTVRAEMAMIVSAQDFSTEANYDGVIIGGTVYTPSVGREVQRSHRVITMILATYALAMLSSPQCQQPCRCPSRMTTSLKMPSRCPGRQLPGDGDDPRTCKTRCAS